MAAEDHEAGSDLVALLLGTTRMLDKFAAAAEAPATGGRVEPAPDDPLLAAALGIVSLRRSLRRWLLLASDGPANAHTEAPVEDPSTDSVSLR